MGLRSSLLVRTKVRSVGQTASSVHAPKDSLSGLIRANRSLALDEVVRGDGSWRLSALEVSEEEVGEEGAACGLLLDGYWATSGSVSVRMAHRNATLTLAEDETVVNGNDRGHFLADVDDNGCALPRREPAG